MANKTPRKKAPGRSPTPRIMDETITVGQLLDRIRQLILEEPKRLNMKRWVAKLSGRFSIVGRRLRNELANPACGTVGCLAGWGAVLLRGPGAKPSVLDAHAESVMTRLLGWDQDWSEYRTVGALFADTVIKELDGEAHKLPNPGTRAHARFVARRINVYKARHTDILDRVIDVAEARKALSA